MLCLERPRPHTASAPSPQVERATARLQFWEGLRAGTLPESLSCAEKLHASGLIQRAEASVTELRAKRRIVVPEGSSADLQAR